MIDVEIRGPVAKKEYEYLRKHLENSGENIVLENQATILYVGEYSQSFTEVEISSGQKSKMVLRDSRAKTETVIDILPGQFSKAVEFCGKIGYKKGVVYVREVLSAKYGGAHFALFDPLQTDALYYEAVITVNDPVSAKEAKKKLEVLARKFKLPIWGNLEMVSFFEKLNKQSSYVYDFNTDGVDYFKDRFGI